MLKAGFRRQSDQQSRQVGISLPGDIRRRGFERLTLRQTEGNSSFHGPQPAPLAAVLVYRHRYYYLG